MRKISTSFYRKIHYFHKVGKEKETFVVVFKQRAKLTTFKGKLS